MKYFNTIWNRIWDKSYNTHEGTGTTCTDGKRTTTRCDIIKNSTVKVKLKCIFKLAIAGVLTFTFGLLVLLLQPYDILFKSMCVLKPGGEIFELWEKPPVDLYLKVYLFNITNKDAFLEGREKLKVEEVGPYVYREFLTHENVTFNDNGTVSAVPSHPLQWEPELSEGHKEEDQLILPHIALLAIAHVMAEESYFTQFGLNLVIRQTSSYPLVQMSAKEFMFGYQSALSKLGSQFMSDRISFDKVGLIERMYDFKGDFETIYTGERDVAETGLYDTYKGSSQLPQWEGECGNIRNASDATKFRGYLKPDDKLLFYRKSLCRASTLVRVNETVASGLNGYYYTFEEDSLDNGKNNTNNTCFCRKGKCLTPGILDVRDCYYGFPIGVSFPHFLYGDPSLRDSVDGSKPDPELHKSHFVIEPVSGLPLKVAARYQINMVLGNLDSIAHVERFSNMVLPMLWIEIAMAGLPQNLQLKFNIYLSILPVVQTVLIYVCFIVGTFLLSVASYKYLQKVKSVGKLYYTSNWKNSHCFEEDINRKLSMCACADDCTDLSSQKDFDACLVAPLNRIDEEREVV